jgi:transposase
MARLYVEEGLSTRAISRRLFWHYATVNNVLRADGVQLRGRGGTHNRAPQDEIDRTIELYNSGLSSVQVGEILGIDSTSVRGRLHRAGVEMRSDSLSQRLRFYRAAVENGAGGLTDRQAVALGLVEDAPATTVEVAERLGVTRHAAYEVLVQLKTRGLIKAKRRRRPDRLHNVWQRTDLSVRDVVEYALAPPPQRRSGDVWLGIEPFRDWLEQQIDTEQRLMLHIPTDEDKGIAPTPGAMRVATRLGLDDRRLYALRYEQRSVTLAVVDQCLLRAGDGTMLEDLWPEFGSDEEVARLPRSYQQRDRQLEAAA